MIRRPWLAILPALAMASFLFPPMYVASAQDVAPEPDAASTLTWSLEQLRSGHVPLPAIIGIVFLIVKFSRGWLGARVPLFRSPAGVALLAGVVSGLGGLLQMLVNGRTLDGALVIEFLVGWVGSAGFQSVAKDIGQGEWKPRDSGPVVGSSVS